MLQLFFRLYESYEPILYMLMQNLLYNLLRSWVRLSLCTFCTDTSELVYLKENVKQVQIARRIFNMARNAILLKLIAIDV